jgi:hypothetical protein
MRKSLRAAVGSVVGALVLSACSVGGHPNPVANVPSDPGVLNAHGFDLDAKERAEVELTRQILAIDPCALLDAASVTKAGDVKTLGPDYDLTDCSARFTRSGTKSYSSSSVTVEVSLSGPSSTDTPTTLDGIAVVTDTFATQAGGVGGCGYYLPLPLPVPDELADADIEPFVSVRVREYGESTDSCPLAADLVRSANATLKKGLPKHDMSKVKSTFLGHSPCEAIDVAPLSPAVTTWDISTYSPYSCSFSTSDADARTTVRFDAKRVYERSSSSTDPEPIEKDGRQLVVEKRDTSCNVIAYFKNSFDNNYPGSKDPPTGKEIDEYRSAVVVDSEECDYAQQLALDVARRFDS